MLSDRNGEIDILIAERDDARAQLHTMTLASSRDTDDENKVQTLRSQLDKAEGEVDELRLALSTAEKRLKESTDQYASYVNDLKHQREANADLTDTNSALRSEITQLEARIHQLELEVDDADNRARANAAHRKAEAVLTVELEAMTEEADQLRESLYNAEKELEDEADSHAIAIQKVRTRLGDVEGELAIMKTALEEEQRRSQSLADRLAEKPGEVAAIDAEMAELRAEVAEMHGQLTAARVENEVATSKLSTVQGRAEEYKAEIAKLSSTVAEQNMEARETANKAAIAQEKLRNELHEATETAAVLRTRLEQLTASASRDRERSQADLDRQAADLASTRDKLVKTEDALDQAHADIAAMNNELDARARDIDDANARAHSLETSLEEAKRKLGEAEDRHAQETAEARRRISELKTALAEAEAAATEPESVPDISGLEVDKEPVIEQLRLSLADAQESISRLRTEAESRVRLSADRERTLVTQLADERTRLAAETERHGSALEELRAQLREANMRRATVEHEKTMLSTRVATLERSLADSRGVDRSQRPDVRQTHVSGTGVDDRLKIAQQEASRAAMQYETELATIKPKLQRLELRVDQLRRECDRHKVQHKADRERMAEMERAYSTEASQLRAQCRAAEQHASRCQDETAVESERGRRRIAELEMRLKTTASTYKSQLSRLRSPGFSPPREIPTVVQRERVESGDERVAATPFTSDRWA
ncbi:Chromosome partition protein Smc [Carpediemonas membranifera]|uniref:Chromosome partition protein Smc n=1 Tax=Carpediemonas membranifera TaxID=201153 RepID=A0A8J6ATG1_9EUKA|nr:Chromosome partition protein Smc [Carpediemonas membranifera]|eukprot:KAG9393673.1 Chromosome partition protein Smc [Carpediemonas membranifera]